MNRAPGLRTAEALRALAGDREPQVAVVLGSGLGDVAARLTGARAVRYGDIDGLPESTVVGHEGAVYAGVVAGLPALVFAGRVHLYEGHDARTVTTAVRAAVRAGCSTVVLTNAAGALDPGLTVGAPCLISDHLNLTGANPLIGAHALDEPRFPDMSSVYDGGLRALAAGMDEDLEQRVYAGLVGPSYETPAEVQMLRTLGAGLVGMSTVLEAIAARALGARVLGISVVTNLAAGLTLEPLSHEEVATAGRQAAARLERLLLGVLERLGSSA